MKIMREFVNRTIVLLALFVPIFLYQNEAAAINETEEIYAYNGLYQNSGFTLDEKNSEIAVGDTTASAKYCDKNSKYICVNSEVFNFSVPRNLGSVGTEWEQAGHKYFIVIPLHKTKYFGKEINVMLFSTVHEGNSERQATTDYFLYSPSLGLLAIESKTPGVNRLQILVLASATGFGAV